MIITKNNLNEVLFENHDARLLIHDIEISVRMAIDIYNRAYKADEEDSFYSVSFLSYSGKHSLAGLY